MLKDIVHVRPLDDYCLFVRYEDGVEGTISLRDLVSFSGIFEPLQEPEYFRQVRVNPELGSIGWPNGADLDPDVLYEKVSRTTTQAN